MSVEPSSRSSVEARAEWTEFTAIHVETNADSPGDERDGEVQVSLEIEPAEEPEDDEEIRLWLVRLTVQATTPLDEAEMVQPYEILITNQGVFSVAHGLTRSGAEAALAAVAGDALYGSAREMVLGLTGRCSNGPFQLPAFDFTDLQEEPPTEPG